MTACHVFVVVDSAVPMISPDGSIAYACELEIVDGANCCKSIALLAVPFQCSACKIFIPVIWP